MAIEKTFAFKNYLRTMAFVNAIAYIAEQQNHHPELLVRYKTCSVRFNTHDVGGISESDFSWIAEDWPLEHPRYVGRDLDWAAWLALRAKVSLNAGNAASRAGISRARMRLRVKR